MLCIHEIKMLGWFTATKRTYVPPGKRCLLLKKKLNGNNNRDRAELAERWRASAIGAFGFEEVIRGLPWNSHTLESMDYLAFLHNNYDHDKHGAMTRIDIRNTILKMLDGKDIMCTGMIDLLEHISSAFHVDV